MRGTSYEFRVARSEFQIAGFYYFNLQSAFQNPKCADSDS